MKLKPITLCIALLSIPAFAQSTQPASAPAVLPDPHAVEVYPDPVIRLARLGKYVEAVKLGKETVEALAKDADKGIPARVHAMANLASVYITLARYSDAKDMLDSAEKLLDKDDKDYELAKADVNEAQGGLAFETGEYEDAEHLAAKALDIRRKQLANDDPLVADAMESVIMANIQLGVTQGADRQILRLLRLRTGKFGAASLPVADTYSALGFYYMSVDDYAHARTAYQKCLDIRKKLLGEANVDMADCLYGLSQVDSATDHDDDAGKKLEKARAILNEALGKDHPYVAFADESLAQNYAKAGDGKKALAIALEAVEICKLKFGVSHVFYADALEQEADVLRTTDQAAKADELQQQVEDIRGHRKKKIDL